jgi:hypothetical protein
MPRLLVRLCHTRPLDFADCAIPDNALEGALEHLLNTNYDRAYSVLLELLGSIGSRGDDRLATLLTQTYWDLPHPIAQLILRLTAARKQKATEVLTTMFEEILKTHGIELLRAGFVSRLAAVCHAMEDLAGVAETADSFLEWTEAIGPGERRRLVEAIGRSGLADGLLGAERRTGDDFNEETVGCAIAWLAGQSSLNRAMDCGEVG